MGKERPRCKEEICIWKFSLLLLLLLLLVWRCVFLLFLAVVFNHVSLFSVINHADFPNDFLSVAEV